jgi:hypothetical protein
MSESKQTSKVIFINGVTYLVRQLTELTYEHVLAATRLPMGTSVVYISTKKGKSGILEPKQKCPIEDRMAVSAIVIAEEQPA